MAKELKEARAEAHAARAQLDKAQALLQQYQQTILTMQVQQTDRDAVQAEQLRAAVGAPRRGATPGGRTPARAAASAARPPASAERPLRSGSARERPTTSEQRLDAKRGWEAEQDAAAASSYDQWAPPHGVTNVHVHSHQPALFGGDGEWAAHHELALLEEEMRALHADIDATASHLVEGV